jgi:hypothetical protein
MSQNRYATISVPRDVKDRLKVIIASTALAKEITLRTKDRDFEPISERLDVKFI